VRTLRAPLFVFCVLLVADAGAPRRLIAEAARDPLAVDLVHRGYAGWDRVNAAATHAGQAPGVVWRHGPGAVHRPLKGLPCDTEARTGLVKAATSATAPANVSGAF